MKNYLTITMMVLGVTIFEESMAAASPKISTYFSASSKSTEGKNPPDVLEEKSGVILELENIDLEEESEDASVASVDSSVASSGEPLGPKKTIRRRDQK